MELLYKQEMGLSQFGSVPAVGYAGAERHLLMGKSVGFVQMLIEGSGGSSDQIILKGAGGEEKVFHIAAHPTLQSISFDSSGRSDNDLPGNCQQTFTNFTRHELSGM